MTLPTEKRTLLTIVTEAVVEQTLLRDFDRLGARGYTVSDAHGKGSRGVRDAAWNEAANIRIEVICAEEQAEILLRHLQERYYARMTEILEALLDETCGDESHPAMGLVDIVGDLIEDYEAEHHALPETTGVLALKFLMDQHGLKQSDLSEIGSQGIVSEILAGKRELNIRQVRALSERFGVSAASFV